MIGIRADGNSKIGTGHIMRCLTIAGALSKQDTAPLFFCIDGGDMVEKAGFDCVRLEGVYDDLSGEDLSAQLSRHGVTTLLVDSYFAGAGYYDRLPKNVHTARIFDLGDPAVPCDLLIDYNINFNDFNFPHAGKVLLGPRYAPLREEFSTAPKRQRESISQVLITVGGADGNNVAEKLMRAVAGERGLDGVFFHVVSGAANPWADSLAEAASTYSGRFLVHQNVQDMAALMNIADAALTAGGSTLYELCAMGVPCVALSIADNQDRMVEAMEGAGIMISADRVAGARDAQCAARELAILRQHPAQVRRMAKAARSMVDGAGARRIAYEMIQLDNRGPNV